MAVKMHKEMKGNQFQWEIISMIRKYFDSNGKIWNESISFTNNDDKNFNKHKRNLYKNVYNVCNSNLISLPFSLMFS